MSGEDEVQRAIGRIEGQLASNTLLLNDIRNDLIRHFEDDRRAFESIGVRVSGAEKKLWWLSGIASAVAVVVTKLMGHFN